MVGKCELHHGIRGVEISVNMRWGRGQQGADAVKTVPAWIFVQHSRCFNVKYHAQNVVDGVGVFLPAQAVVFHQAALRHAGRGAIADLFRDQFSRPTNLLGCWLRFLLRRHLTGVDSQHDFVPRLCDLRIREVGGEVVETKIALLLLTPVAP